MGVVSSKLKPDADDTPTLVIVPTRLFKYNRPGASHYNTMRTLMKRLWAPWRLSYLRSDASDREKGCLLCDMLHAGEDSKKHVLYRGEHVFVALNLYPYSNGHLMVVPNRHVATLEDLDEATLTELMALTQQCLALLRTAYKPEGFNVGFNIGSAAGAGIADHLHQHVVPRWVGDTNFMSTVAETRVIPEWIDQTYAELRLLWMEMFPSQESASE